MGVPARLWVFDASEEVGRDGQPTIAFDPPLRRMGVSARQARLSHDGGNVKQDRDLKGVQNGRRG